MSEIHVDFDKNYPHPFTIPLEIQEYYNQNTTEQLQRQKNYYIVKMCQINETHLVERNKLIKENCGLKEDIQSLNHKLSEDRAKLVLINRIMKYGTKSLKRAYDKLKDKALVEEYFNAD